MPNPPRSKREHLLELVRARNQWCGRQLTDSERKLGFLGWHERGYLPHCDFPDLVQFVTFRLEDSMPAARRSEWEHLLAIEDQREKRTRLEEYLDRGIGACWLRDEIIARIAEEALVHFHNERYELLAWCVMPNHVHVLVDVQQTPLWRIVQGWKVRVAREARMLLRAERRAPARLESCHSSHEPSGCSALRSFWQREYWDAFMRGEQQERTAIRYIENNPVRAMLIRSAEEWPFSSARFRDVSRKLVVTVANNRKLKGE